MPDNPRRILWALACLAAGVTLLLVLDGARALPLGKGPGRHGTDHGRARTRPGVEAVCRAAVDAWGGSRSPEDAAARVETCARLAGLADEAGPHAALTLALAFQEAHFGADDSGGIRGPCQVAACHCPGRTFRGCDLEVACVATLGRLLSEEQGSERVALRRWLRGPRGRRGPVDEAGEAFIGAVLARAEWFARALVRAAEGRPES